MSDRVLQLGIISDTHGLLRPEAVDVLTGVNHIIHAGDVDRPEILEQLRDLAPVSVVRGNMDLGEWARELPVTDVVSFAGVDLFVVHDIADLDLDPAAAGFAAVIYGHSHRPEMRESNGVLFLNPGSAGPRRFRLQATLAIGTVQDGRLSVRMVELV